MKVFGLFALLAATIPCASPLEPTNVSPSTDPQAPAHLSPRDGYPDIYQFNITLIEQCSDGVLVALGWARGQHLDFGKDPGEGHHLLIDIVEQTYNITVGPYSYAQHTVPIQVDGCKWTSDGRALGGFNWWPCGWSVVQVTQVVTLTALPSPVDDMTIDPATPIATPGSKIPKVYDPSSPGGPEDPEDDPEDDFPEDDPPEDDPLATEPASTQTLYPQILSTTLPSSPHNQPSIILPFNFTLSEWCGSHGEHLAGGSYTNGNIRRLLDLSFEVVLSIKHHIPGYASELVIGPLDNASRVLRFAYQDCEWADQRNQSCAQCVTTHG
ncbi:hypothetical protein E8E13_004134 [Curvularia kusanoi]|uniref:Uncharacterized protein n=1 Tax=Curvularia kusanoi TaxID=90978 RepID=A0A9P4TB72_CURKU|nr:hypothetical protein E8E13_004134 [Curvularia kusanoi]